MVSPGLPLGRYMLFDVIASGGMASVHFGRMAGAGGFTRTVAIKRLHPHLAHDDEFATMFLDEARLAARIQHPNVVATLDVASVDGELLLVMDYVRGETLARLLTLSRQQDKSIPQRILVAIILGTLFGLHAAHEAKSERGEPLAIVHRDVSPQNVLVGADGMVRVVDFGVAKAASRAHSTRDGKVKGKLSYMAPEQLKREEVDRRADVYAIGVMTWEALAAKKLFVADDALAIMHAVLNEPVMPIASVASGVSDAVAAVVHRALDRDPTRRFPTAMAMAEALEAALAPAPQREVAAWVKEIAGASLDAREATLAEIESSTPTEAMAPPASADVVRLSEQTTAVTPGPTAAPNDASLVTGISVVHDDAPARRRSRWPVILGLGAVLVSVAGVAAWRFRSPPAPVPAATTAPANVATSIPTASSSMPVVSTPVLVVASAPSASTRSIRARPLASSKPKPNCNPPVYVDSSGIEHIKAECL